MEQTWLASGILPLTIFLILLGLGMTLTPQDFRQILQQRWAVAVGLMSQLVLLPLLAFAVALTLPLDPIFALSLILIAACPGGATSNLLTHFFDGDRALSVTLTAISSALILLTLPVIFNLGSVWFLGSVQAVRLPLFATMLQLALFTLAPIIVGMALKHYFPDWAARNEKHFRRAPGLFFLLVVVALIFQNWSLVLEYAVTFSLAIVLLNILALITGYFLARGLRLPKRQAVTVAIETGVQNFSIAYLVAVTLLNMPQLAILPGLYGLLAMISGLAFGTVMYLLGFTRPVSSPSDT